MKINLLAFLLFIIVPKLGGQTSSLLSTITQDSAIHLYITTDWKNIERNKSEKTYQDAEVKFTPNGSDTIMLPAKIRTRGNMRLQICSQPPLKLKFEKSDLASVNLSGMNEMDIINPCHDAHEYDQYLLKEYLAYKLWELVSPNYFRTQLIHIHYLKPDGTEDHDVSFAFIAENTEELVDRLSGKRNKTPIISNRAVDKAPMLNVALFEFMIGNTDWNIQNRHNLEFVILPGHALLVTIPFDFDYSGLVSTPYAVHHESIELTSVSTRYYQGWCFTEAEVEEALKVFREQKQIILQMPYRIQGLDEKAADQARNYLNGFFEVIENPKKLESQIVKHCDMWPIK